MRCQGRKYLDRGVNVQVIARSPVWYYRQNGLTCLLVQRSHSYETNYIQGMCLGLDYSETFSNDYVGINGSY